LIKSWEEDKMVKVIKKMLSMGIVILMVLVVFAGMPMNVSAEEPEEPWVDSLDGQSVEGFGTHFRITSGKYLDITLVSTESVQINLKSIPYSVSFQIESDTDIGSTQITISGFQIGKTYYRYQDFKLQDEFIVDETNTIIFTQDLLIDHHVIIQEYEFTAIIDTDGAVVDGEGNPSSDPIIRDGDTYTLTDDFIHKPLIVLKSNIIIDGKRHSISGSPISIGIYLKELTGVTIQ
jgi:hypothetical protein